MLKSPFDQIEGKRIAENLRESEARFQALFDQAAVGIAQQALDLTTTDGDGGFVQVNARYCEILGRSCEELLQLSYRDITPTEDLEKEIALRKQMLAGTIPHYSIEKRYFRKDGELVWTRMTGSLVRDAYGEPLYFLTIIEDIDAQKRASEALRASEERFRLLVDGVQDYALILLDPEGHIASWNPGAQRLFGYPESAMLGRSLSHLYVPELVKAGIPKQVLMEAVSHGRSYRENWNQRADGSRFLGACTVIPLRDEHGQLRGFSKIIQNVTERRQDEEQIQQLNTELEHRVQERTAELLAANQELEAFSYSVSHDLRGPLRAINGFSHAIQEECGDALDPACREDLQRVRQATMRMGRIIDALLDLSKVSRSEMHWEDLCLSTLADQVANELRQRASERTVELIIAPDLCVRGDAHLLRIALENLLGNAWKYTSRIEQARIELGVSEHEGHTVYFVRDNGAGFEMEQADKLFEPFQRLHSNREFEGTGVGLSTVKRIICRHGGRVWAEASPAQGASFFFTLTRC